MDDKTTDIARVPVEQCREWMGWGARIGEHHALEFVAHKCTAADAVLLKDMRDSGKYKKMGYTWDRFCVEVLGISSRHANRMILNLETFGPNFFRLSELVQVSPQSYKLIAGSISDDGIEIDGEIVPLKKENREKIAAAVQARRPEKKADADRPTVPAARRKLTGLMAELHLLAKQPDDRLELIGLVEEGSAQLAALSQYLRETTLTVQIEYKP